MRKNLGEYAVAAAVYAAFAIYLYQPHLKSFDRFHYLTFFNVWLASMGCFVLSRRWVSAFTGSIIAGAIYGFGPFVLGLGKFHPTAGLVAAAIPWLFCPAAFGFKHRWRWLSWPLSALPFLAIPLLLETAAYFRLFAIPLKSKLHIIDLARLFAPIITAEQGAASIGFYHVPLGALLIGFSMLFAARRFGILTILVLGSILAFCNPVFNTGPIIWLAIPSLVCSILIGEGFLGLTLAGASDRKLLLTAAVFLAVLSFIALLLAANYSNTFAGLAAGYAKLFIATAMIYMLGAVTIAIIYFIVRAGLRLQWLRLILICSAAAIDIFFSARFITDRIF